MLGLVSLLEIATSSSVGELKMFGKKNLGKCAMYIGIEVMPRLCCTFIVDFEYYLFIVNATLWNVFVENQKGVIFMRVVAN